MSATIKYCLYVYEGLFNYANDWYKLMSHVIKTLISTITNLWLYRLLLSRHVSDIRDEFTKKWVTDVSSDNDQDNSPFNSSSDNIEEPTAPTRSTTENLVTRIGVPLPRERSKYFNELGHTDDAYQGQASDISKTDRSALHEDSDEGVHISRDDREISVLSTNLNSNNSPTVNYDSLYEDCDVMECHPSVVVESIDIVRVSCFSFLYISFYPALIE